MITLITINIDNMKKIINFLKKLFYCECDNGKCISEVAPHKIEMIDLKEAALITGYSYSHLRKLCNRHKICCAYKNMKKGSKHKWMVSKTYCESHKKSGKWTL